MPSLKKPTTLKKTPAKKAPAKTTKPIKAAKLKEEVEVPMKYFICLGCNKKYLDTGDYFYGKNSTKCIWCTKFPTSKK